jgi:hypothetical protein
VEALNASLNIALRALVNRTRKRYKTNKEMKQKELVINDTLKRMSKTRSRPTKK